MSRGGWIASGALILTSVASLTQAGTDSGTAAAEPVIQLANGRIAACGVRFTWTGEKPPLAVSLLNVRMADTTQIVLTVALPPGAVMPNMSLATTGRDTAQLLDPVAPGVVEASTGEAILARATPSPSEGALLFQELMIGGATITLAAPGAPTRSVVAPGPLPHQTRATYLQCAGDLFPRTR
jgi:hypothetical protein